MKNKNVSQSNLNFVHKVAAYLLSVLMVVYPVSPSLADVLDDYLIQTQLDTDPTFEYVNSEAEQYQITPFADGSVPVNYHVQRFYEQLLDNKPEALRDPPKLIPIAVGDITIFIPQAIELSLVGSPAVQNRYVRTQILNLLGRHLINPLWKGFETESAQIATLYDNAYDYASNNSDKKFGDLLELDTESNSTSYDFVWPEYRQINGESVLVPIVYLSENTVAERRVVKAEREITGSARTFSLDLQGADVELGGFLQTAEDLINNRGSISSNADLQIIVGGALENLSGVIGSVGNLTISANNITNQTIVYQYGDSQNAQSYYAEIAEINSSSGDVVLRSNSDVTILGANVSANAGAITVAADGDIYIGTQQLYNASSGSGGGATYSRSTVSHLVSRIGAQDTIQLIANGQIVLDAAEIVSDEGHIEILAGLGIIVQDALSESRRYSKSKFGKTSLEISAYKTVAMRSLLDAGKGINIHTDFGDITLRAADISTTQGTSISASNGGVNLLVTRENDHYSYSSVKESLFTVTTINRGHDIETIVPNTIVGGLIVDALSGITVEYEGDPNLGLDEQIFGTSDSPGLADMPGLEWLTELREQTDEADWLAVQGRYKEWNERSTSLSPAAMALISIAVAIAVGPAVAGLYGGTATTVATVAGSSTLGAAAVAGTTSIIATAALAASNAAVNGDDPFEAAFQAVTDDDTLKSAAIAAVTAGAMAQLDADLFNVGDKSFSYVEQATQAVTQAAVSSGISAIASGGDVSGFEDLFVSSLLSNLASVLGKNIATEIGSADLNDFSRYLAHAALGCGLGAIEAEISSGNTNTGSGCSSGAGGAVIGELTASIYGEIGWDSNDESFQNWKSTGVDISQLTAAFVVTIAGGDTNIAAMTGRNAAEYNALSLKEKVKYGVKGAQCFFAQDTGSCFASVALETVITSINNDLAFAEGLWSGVKAEGEALANLDEDLLALFKVIVAGDFKTVASGLRDAVVGLPQELIAQADALVELSVFAEGPDEYRQIGETLAPLMIDVVVGLATLGTATATKKTFEALADTAANTRRSGSASPNLSQGEGDDFYQSVEASTNGVIHREEAIRSLVLDDLNTYRGTSPAISRVGFVGDGGTMIPGDIFDNVSIGKINQVRDSGLIVRSSDNNSYRVADVDGYIDALKNAYSGAGQSMNPRMESLIRDAVIDTDFDPLTINGMIGTHSEILAVNRVLNDSPGVNFSDITVATIRTENGADFPACTNCGSILQRTDVNVVTGYDSSGD